MGNILPDRHVRWRPARTIRILAMLTLAWVVHRSPSATAQSAGSRYHVVHGWPVLPEGTTLGFVSAVGVDLHDNVFVFQRGNRTWPDSDTLDMTVISSNTVLLFDGRTGMLLAQWGANHFAFPHGLTVDRKDNVWLTDVALHQVYKFSHDGRLLLTLGERGVSGDDSAHFNRPTDVAIAADGSFFVSDGYGNNRVVKFSRNGRFIMQWGVKGKLPGQFDLPHGIALDARGKIYVSDRSNGRVQIFDPDGRYLRQWMGPAVVSPNGVALGSDGTAFIVDDGGRDSIPDRSGIVVLRPDGSMVERFGRWGNYDGQFIDIHDVAVAKDGAVYVGDVTGRRVQKFVRRR
jgi:peptidylamidoglycolate lyase